MNAALAVFHKQLGDLVLLEPALRRLATLGGPTDLITAPQFAPLLELFGTPCRITPAWGARAARLASYDTSSRSTWSAALARSPRKQLLSASPDYVGWSHRLVYDDVRVEPLNHQYRARYYWSHTPGEEAGGFQPPRLRPPPADWRPPELPAGEFVLIHPTAAWQRKCWTPDDWREIAGRLREALALPIVLTSGRAEWEAGHCAAIAGHERAFINLAGRTSLQGYLATVAAARLVVCVDGSAAHLACGFGRPCVALFGPTDARHWFLPSPTAAVVTPVDGQGAASKNLADLTADRVWAGVETLLPKGRS